MRSWRTSGRGLGLLLAFGSALAVAASAQQAVQLDNVAANPFGYVRVADQPALDPAQLTLETWITPQGPGAGGSTDPVGAVVAGKVREGTSGTFLMPFGLTWSGGTSRVTASVRTGVNQGALTLSNRTVPIATTAHVAMTFDGTRLNLYIDGILTSCATTGGLPIDYGTEDFLMGAANLNSGFVRRFDGRIDEVRLWSHARTPLEVLASAGAPVTGTEPGLVAYWNFDSGDFTDGTGNGHDGVAQGTEWSFVPELTPTIPGGAPLGTTYCSPAVDNSTGAPGSIAAFGSPLLADNTLFLMASSLPSAEFGYFLTSLTQGLLSPPASSGVVCLGGDIGRFNAAADIGQGPCLSVRIDLGSFPVNPPQAPMAGESWNFQCWYRDGATNNFTDALTVTFLDVKRSHSSGNKEFNPETLALGYGYDPALSAGSVKPPVFLTSTFQFATAAEGKRFFELAYGLREPEEGEESGLIYSRLNNPNLQIFEERMAAWDRTDQGATFASGMAAISTTILALVEPHSVVVSTAPVYGGTHYLLEHILPRFGVERRFLPAGDGAPQALERVADEVGRERIRMVFVETPANPSLVHTDIAAMAAVTASLGRPEAPAGLVVDNTLLGPVFQRPATQGADIVLYSATKFLGGHSDLVAGVATGSGRVMERVLESRTILGTSTTPFNGWLLLRSLETVSIRMRRQAKTAHKLAKVLRDHPHVLRVHYPGLLEEDSDQGALFQRQCTGAGSLIAFEVEGGEEAAFRVLDRFEVFRLAVSLGGTESLVEHPATMTHADVPPADNARVGVTPGLIRMSVGLEHRSDLERDLRHALEI